MAQDGTWPYDDSSWWSWWWEDQEESDSSWWWDDNEESAELKDLRDQVKAHEDKLNLLLQQMVETTKLVESLQREVQDLKDSGARSSTSEAPHSSSRGPSPAPGRNEACVHRGAGKVVWDQQPREGRDMWSWASHLQSTLFRDMSWAQWKQIYNVLTENSVHFEVRDCSTTPANRTFTLVCTRCWASCKGKYGSSVAEASRVGARQALTQFILGTDALASDEEVSC